MSLVTTAAVKDAISSPCIQGLLPTGLASFEVNDDSTAFKAVTPSRISTMPFFGAQAMAMPVSLLLTFSRAIPAWSASFSIVWLLLLLLKQPQSTRLAKFLA